MARTTNAPLLLVDDGEPARPDEVAPHLAQRLRSPASGGRPGPLRRLLAPLRARLLAPRVARRLEMLGGRNPRRDLLEEVARLLEAELARRGHPRAVLAAYRWASPTLAERFRQLADRGVGEADLLAMDPFGAGLEGISPRLAQLSAAGEAGLRLRTIGPWWGGRVEMLRLLLRNVRASLAGLEGDARVLFCAPPGANPSGEEKRWEQVAEAARVLAELLPEGTEALLAPLRSRGPLGEAGDGPRSAVADLAAGEGTPLLLAPLGVALDGFDTLYSLDISLRRYAERRGVREVLLCPPYNSDPAFVSGLADLSEESG